MKAIPTEYNGYNFRSRLEATWACFFNHMNIPYQYEPRLFYFPGGVKYLPDFWLPAQECWLEIKPTFVLAGRAFEKLDMLSYATHQKVVLFYDGVSEDMCGLRFYGDGTTEPGYRWSVGVDVALTTVTENGPRTQSAILQAREFMDSGPLEDAFRETALNPWSHPNSILPDRNRP